MNQDLEKLIMLQRFDSTAHAADKRIAEDPERQRAFDARLEAAKAAVASAKQLLADSQTARRAIEKDVSVQQGRLSKFTEQAMAVKAVLGLTPSAPVKLVPSLPVTTPGPADPAARRRWVEAEHPRVSAREAAREVIEAASRH